jgi:hypothetical protein
MRPMTVMMAFDGVQCVLQMRFPDQDEVVEGFAAFADKAFRKGVALRRGRWGLRADTRLAEKCRSVLRPPPG